MCGRFILRTFPESYFRSIGVHQTSFDFEPRYNIAPSQPIAVLAPPFTDSKGSAGLVVTWMRWGFTPSWSKDPQKMGGWINARGETVFEKPAFRSAAKSRRCLIPADGFYEWEKTADGKQPHLFERPNGEPFLFAGIWETWTPPDGDPVETVAIITTEPNAVTAPIHNRSPVVITPQAATTWVYSPDKYAESLSTMLRPAPDDFWTSRPVSKAVNSPANDSPDMLR